MHHVRSNLQRNLPKHGAAQPRSAVHAKSLIEIPLWRFLLSVHGTFLTSSALPSPLQPPAKYLLPEMIISDYGKKCVVIDLDETLVHSSFKVNAEEQPSFAQLD